MSSSLNKHNPNPAINPSEAPPTRTQRGRKKVAAAAGTTANWLAVLIAVCLILLAVLLLAARIGLPWLGNYKSQVESRLSERMRSPVVIDDLSFRWQQFGPKLSATGVSLIESADRQVTLDEVLIDMNVLKSISEGTPIIDELTLVGAKLALEAGEGGQFELHGLKQSTQQNGTSNNRVDVLAWLMDTNRVGLQDATITLIDSVDNEELVITNLNIVAVNENDLHQLRVDMQLPEKLGGQLEMGLDLIGTSDDIRNASASVHIKATDLKVDGWRALQARRFKGLRASTTGIARLDATTQLELWGNVWSGKLQTARGQLQATDLVDLDTNEKVLDRMTADVVYKNASLGWQLSTDILEFQNGSDLTSVNDVVYQYKPDANTAWQLDASGDSLKLDVATRLVLSLFHKDADLPRARWLAQAKPKGDLYNWDASFGLVNGKPDFSLFSIFKDLELESAGGFPGASRIAGTIDMQHNVGTVAMQGIDMTLDVPSAYAKPLKLEKLYADLDVDVRDPLRTSLKGEVNINDRGFDSSTRIEVKLEPGASPHLYTQGKFNLDDLSEAKRYLPVRWLKPKTTQWLNQALVAGQATNGELLMFGNVADYPFVDNEGVFKIGFDIEDATLNYLTPWPQATKLQGRFDMEGVSMFGTATDGQLDSMRFSSVVAKIADIRNPVMELSSTSSGSLPSLINFANTGPLKKTLAPALSDVSSTGRAQMDLNISMPLRRKAKLTTIASAQASLNKPRAIAGLKVNGSVFLRNNDIAFSRSKLELSDVDGAVGFNQNGLRVNNLNALMYGRPVRIDAKTEGRGTSRVTEISMAGPMRAANILKTYNIPLTQFVDGESHWNVSVRIPAKSNAKIQVAAVSGLVGTRMLLPKPLGKSVGASTQMALSGKINPNNAYAEWLIDYGNIMRSMVRVDDDGMQSFSARFGGGAPNPNVEEGIRLAGNIDNLALDGWVESVAQFIDDLPPSDTPEPILPISADLNVGKFIAGQQFIGGGSLRFNTDSDYVNGVIDNQWLSGSVRYPRVHWTQDMPAIVRISSVDKRIIDALDSAPERADNGGELDPRTLPPIEARVARVRWDLLDLKDLTIRTKPSVSGLDITTFGFAYQSAQLIGDGYWRLRDPQNVNPSLADQHVSKLNLTLQGNDFGSLLANVGFGGTLHEGEGVLAGSLVWPGPAYKPSLESLVGKLNIDMQKGRILKVEPGAARLVGLFAIQSIPRRLSLDFKDLVLDGLDYETIRGEVQLANGIAHAPLVQLNGSVGVIDIAGESNLVTEQYNQRLTVLPRVSAALPIIGIISGGATAGVGALFAGGLLKAVGIDFDRIGLREYTLTGSWEDPTLTLVPFEQPEPQ